MIKLFHKRQTRQFHKELFQETDAVLKNPARGWYQIYTFSAEQPADFEELVWCLKETESLVLVLLDIGYFRQKNLDEQALKNIRDIFDFFSKQKKDMILRIVYDREGKGLEKEPSTLSQVLLHINQIGPVMKEYLDYIFVFQGMMIGSWGEMHTSKFLAPEQLKKIREELGKYLGEATFHAVRRPYYWRMFHTEEQFHIMDAMTLFDDGMFGSDTHLGTFGTVSRADGGWRQAWCPRDEIAFENLICRQRPNGGEVIANQENPSECNLEQMIEVLKKTHVTYLNCVHDESVLNRWKELNAYEYIGNHLGYRFVIRDTEFPAKNGSMLKIMIENIGFGNFCQEAVVWIDVENDGKICDTSLIETDVRNWESGTVSCIDYHLKEQVGTLYLGVKRKWDGHPVLFGNVCDEYGRVKLGELTLQ